MAQNGGCVLPCLASKLATVVAAAAGELAQDQRHQDAVEEVGCDFVPLVVETFGVWSPFCTSNLSSHCRR